MFIRVEDQSGNLTIWLNVNQIAKMEESRSSEELKKLDMRRNVMVEC